MNFNLKWISLTLFAGILLSCGCKEKSGHLDKIQGEVSIDGSSTVYPVTEAIAKE